MFQQMGFGVAVALLLDATIIRSVLLPSAMRLLGDWNWYLPRWLALGPQAPGRGSVDGRALGTPPALEPCRGGGVARRPESDLAVTPKLGRRSEVARDTDSSMAGQAMIDEPGSAHRRLSALIGRWRTQGRTLDTPEAPGASIDAVDTCEWLPGGRALLHIVDARVGDEQVKGAEIIGWDSVRDAYVTQYFGTDGPTPTRRASPRRRSPRLAHAQREGPLRGQLQ